MSSDGSINIADEIGKLQTRIERELKTTYEKLGPWEKAGGAPSRQAARQRHYRPAVRGFHAACR